MYSPIKALQDYGSRVESFMLNLSADVATLTEELINIPSVSGNEQEIADAVQASLEQCDWLTVTRVANSVIAQTNLGRSRRVVLAGHLDTVPAAENTVAVRRSAGEHLPTGTLVQQDVIFGLGSCDMKSGVAVALWIATHIKEPKFDVTYVFYECEEVESARNGLTLISNQHSELLQADVAILLEPSNASIEAGCQGTLRFRINAVGQRAHSARSWFGVNAIHGLQRALDILASYEAKRVVVDGLEYREGLNAVKISGGVASNVIPDEASLEINYRYAPTVSATEAEQSMRELFIDFNMEILDNEPGALPGLAHPALAELVELSHGEVAPKFGWTDVARFAAIGVPAVNLGPGDPSFAHSRDEHVALADLDKCRAILEQWLVS